MNDIQVELFRADEVSSGEWRDLQQLQYRAMYAALPHRSEQEVKELVGFDNSGRFVDSHVDPNSEVGGRFNDSQSYWAPRVAVALSHDDPVGFLYAAGNVSGSRPFVRGMKSLLPSKNYLWLREIAVDPEYQGRGIAKELGLTVLRDAMPFRAVSTYIWPNEMPRLQPVLRSLGFRPDGERYAEVFGPESKRIRQVRMVAPRVGRVIGALKSTEQNV